jgi:hypothetical protein
MHKPHHESCPMAHPGPLLITLEKTSKLGTVDGISLKFCHSIINCVSPSFYILEKKIVLQKSKFENCLKIVDFQMRFVKQPKLAILAPRWSLAFNVNINFKIHMFLFSSNNCK